MSNATKDGRDVFVNECTRQARLLATQHVYVQVYFYTTLAEPGVARQPAFVGVYRASDDDQILRRLIDQDARIRELEQKLQDKNKAEK